MSSLKVVAGGSAAAAVSEFVPQLIADKVASRIAAKDFTLWGKDAESEASIRLGWVTSATHSETVVADVSHSVMSSDRRVSLASYFAVWEDLHWHLR